MHSDEHPTYSRTTSLEVPLSLKAVREDVIINTYKTGHHAICDILSMNIQAPITLHKWRDNANNAQTVRSPPPRNCSTMTKSKSHCTSHGRNKWQISFKK